MDRIKLLIENHEEYNDIVAKFREYYINERCAFKNKDRFISPVGETKGDSQYGHIININVVEIPPSQDLGRCYKHLVFFSLKDNDDNVLKIICCAALKDSVDIVDFIYTADLYINYNIKRRMN